VGVDGTVNKGGGGGASSTGSTGAGGSGVVIIRYPTPDPLTYAGSFTYDSTNAIWRRYSSTGGLTGATGPTGNGVNDIPRITSVVQSGAIYINRGGTITITGTNFVSGCTVNVNGVAATSVTFNSSTSVTAVIPAQAGGTYHLYLTNPDGGTAISTNSITYATYYYFFGTATTTPGNYYASTAYTTDFTLQFRTYVTGTDVASYNTATRNTYWGTEEIWVSTNGTSWTELADRAKYSAYGQDVVRNMYSYSYLNATVAQQNTSWWQVTRSGTTVTCIISAGTGYGTGTTKTVSYTVASSSTPVYIRFGNNRDGVNAGNDLSIVYDTQP
jgi:hypothetical protein